MTSGLPLTDALCRTDCSIAQVRALVAGGAVVDERDEEGVTPLMRAAGRGLVDVMRVLIESGASVRARDIDGQAPLHHAATGGKAEALRLLLENGADIEAHDNVDWTTPLMQAAWGGYAEATRTLIENGADVNARNPSGNTPLMGALGAEVIHALLERGAEINAVNKFGWTALMHAASNGREQETLLLLDRGAEADMQAHNGGTAEGWALFAGHAATAKVLRFHRATRAFREGTAEDTPVTPPLRPRRRPFPGA